MTDKIRKASPNVSVKRKPNAQPTSSKKEKQQNSTRAVTNRVIKTPEEQGGIIPYDENLLERARTQWQFGDWQSLAHLSRETLQHHPDRAKLALLAASGHLQTGNDIEARQFIRTSQDWGINKKLIIQTLISGVYNSLGRTAIINDQQALALQHFKNALAIGLPDCETQLLTQARINEQIAQISQLTIEVNNKCTLDTANHPNGLTAALAAKVYECMGSQDIHEAIDELISSKQFTPRDQILFFAEISDQFLKRSDKATALHFLQTARDQLPQNEESLISLLIKKFIAFGQSETAADIAFKSTIGAHNNLHLSETEKDAIQTAYEKNRQAVQIKSEHGHELLLSYLLSHIKAIKSATAGRIPVVIEIGTTRENIPGQGSTRKLAEFCKQHDLQFITVDMDPHNTRMAADTFNRMGVTFKAITMKGEDFLRDYPDVFDFIFLDAYDFDHNQHSELRQSRYKKFLGSKIDEVACHQMHLDCAKSILSKLAPDGIVCFDDTWLIDGKWTAKGTTAMPFLLENGFKLLEARNRAALLARANVEQKHATI